MNKRSFDQLNATEKHAVSNFVLTINKDMVYKTGAEIEHFFAGINFEYGKTLFCFFKNEKPVATIGTIIKDVIYQGEVFITAVNFAENKIPDFLKCYKQIEDSLKISRPRVIKLGISPANSKLLPYIEKAGFINPYFLYEMNLKPATQEPIYQKVILVPLNQLNSQVYREINNAAFLNCPNGGIISDKEVWDFIEDYKNKPDLIGIFKYNDQPAGTYELSIKGSTGMIESIGIIPQEQGKGLGKLLLKTVISKLQVHGAKEIKLMVISTNSTALNIYLKYGFSKEKIISFWFEKFIAN